jgi:hypothetical protein
MAHTRASMKAPKKGAPVKERPSSGNELS